MKIEINVGDWDLDWGLVFGIRGWGLGLGFGDRDWGVRIGIWDWGLELGTEN